jgi:hypothetical protein
MAKRKSSAATEALKTHQASNISIARLFFQCASVGCKYVRVWHYIQRPRRAHIPLSSRLVLDCDLQKLQDYLNHCTEREYCFLDYQFALFSIKPLGIAPRRAQLHYEPSTVETRMSLAGLSTTTMKLVRKFSGTFQRADSLQEHQVKPISSHTDIHKDQQCHCF